MHNEERAQGTPNKEQNGVNKEQNWGKNDQNGTFLGFCLSWKYKFSLKGAEMFWAPPILKLNCAYEMYFVFFCATEVETSFISLSIPLPVLVWFLVNL